MNLIAQIQQYAAIVFTAFLSAAFLIAGLLFYLLRIKKVAAKEEKINYTNFSKANILDYLRFDDIIEGGSDDRPFGVIVHGNTYTAAIDIIGYNFAEATAEEQQSTMLKAIAFAGIIKDDIQLRQSVTAIQIADNIAEYQQIYKDLDAVLSDLDREYQQTLRQANDHIDDEPEIAQMYLEKLEKLKADIQTNDWLSKECNVLIQHMQILEQRNREAQKSSQLIFSYTYNPGDFTEEEDEAGIKLRAIQELQTKALTYSTALERCGCKCHSLSASELAHSIYDYMHPLSNQSERFDVAMDRALNSLFTTSDSLEEYEKRKIGEDAYEEMMRAYEKRIADDVNKGELEFIRTARNEFFNAGVNPPEDI